MQRQQLTNWCWDAVAVSVHNFLNPKPTRLTQENLATLVLSAKPGFKDVNCSDTPELCNLPERLDDALKQTGNLHQRPLVGRYLSFASIVSWIDKGIPVGVGIAWFAGGAHFVVIDGYRDYGKRGQQVHVQDPLRGPGFVGYNAFVSNYPPGGSWHDTYLIKIANSGELHA